MRALHQYHHSVASYDAISQHMQWIREVAQEMGFAGGLYASHLRSGAPKPFTAIGAAKINSNDLLILHHSQGNPDLLPVLKLPGKKVLFYHNITPAEYFPHDPYLARLSALGRKQIELLRHKVTAAFAQSQYSANDLVSMGYRAPGIFPLFSLDLPAKSPRPFAPGLQRLVFLGRITPHKNQAELIRLLYLLKQRLTGRTELTLAGRADPFYGQYLKWLARILEVDSQIEFQSQLSENKKRALYNQSDLFICTSLHEGFCLPLVEAMRQGVLVVAAPQGAVAETLGTAGWLFRSEKDEGRADEIASLIGNPEHRKQLLLGQQNRLQELARFQNKNSLKTLLSTLME